MAAKRVMTDLSRSAAAKAARTRRPSSTIHYPTGYFLGNYPDRVGQILDVDVQVAGFVGLEGTVRGLGLLRLQCLQFVLTMPP